MFSGLLQYSVPAREGLTAPSTRTASLLSALNAPQDKFMAMCMDSESNQICCNGSHFKEKLENKILYHLSTCNDLNVSAVSVVLKLSLWFVM